MMRTLHENGGAQFSVQVLADPAVKEFINAHAAVLDSGFEKTAMSEGMRQRLQRSDYIFSGMKTFHELNEAFPSLLDENGNRKPFEQFLNDVRKIDKTYNENYLRAEYNFIQSSAEMAARWESFMEDGDRYNLQYRTAHDDKVRPEHAALEGVTLPPSDPFWEEYYPPNGWNCRCTVVQVRKSKHPATSHDEAMALGEEALQKDTKGIFHFNPGMEQKTMPDYNPYTTRRCRHCDIAKGKANLAVFIPDNEMCAACRFLRNCTQVARGPLFHSYIDQLKKEVSPLNLSGVDSLRTKMYYQTKSSFKRAVGHARDMEQAQMYENMHKHLNHLVHERFSALGEGKDMTNLRDKRNVELKKDRGVTGYNVYKLCLNGDVWWITMEVYKNKSETIYHLRKKT